MANKSKSMDLLYEQSWVNLGCLLVIIIVIHIYRRQQTLTEQESIRGLTSPANYSIMVSNIQPGIYNDNDIKQLLIMNWKKREGLPEIRIKKVVQAYFIGDHIELVRLKNELMNEKKKYLRYRKKNGKFPIHVNIDEINSKINNFTQRIQESAEKLRSNLDKTCGTVFITFDTISMAQGFIKRYRLNWLAKMGLKMLKCFCCKNIDDNFIELDGKILSFEMAKDPNDILWENLGYNYNEKLKKRMKTLLASLFLLAFCFALILAISVAKVFILFSSFKNNILQTKITDNYKNDSSIEVQSGIRVLSALSSFLIVFVNSCLTIFIKKFAM